MVSLDAHSESSNSTTDLSTHSSLRGRNMSGDSVPKTADVDVQMRLCCSDLQSLQILDTTTRCDTPLCAQSTVLLPPDTGNNKATTFKASGVLIARMRCQLGDDGNNEEDSPKGFMERVRSLHRRSCSGDLMPSSFNVHEEPPSNTGHGFDEADIWVPSLDLDKEDSQWDKDGSDGLGPDFPSPSYRMLQNLRVRTSKLSLCPSFRRLLDLQVPAALGSPSSSSLLGLSLKRAAGADSPQRTTPHVDDPLFWPFDSKSYWRPEFDGNYLGISPRAGIFRIKRPRARHGLKQPLGFRLQQRNWNKRTPPPPSSLHAGNTKQGGCRRSRLLLVGSSSSSSSRPEKPTPATKKARAPNNQAPHASRGPSRLSRSSTGSSSSEKSADMDASKKKGKDRRPGQSGSGKKKRSRDQSSTMIQYLLEFEAGDHFQVYLGGEIPIEALVGLDEFSGQEGVGKMMRESRGTGGDY